MKIIQANINQIDIIAELFGNYMTFYKKKSNDKKNKAYLSERLNNNECVIFIALNDQNEAIGFVLNYFSFSSISLGKTIVLNDLFVNENFRKLGIGKKLIQRTLELAKERNCIRVDLSTEKTNKTAQSLYKKIGFVQDEKFFSYSSNI